MTSKFKATLKAGIKARTQGVQDAGKDVTANLNLGVASRP